MSRKAETMANEQSRAEREIDLVRFIYLFSIFIFKI